MLKKGNEEINIISKETAKNEVIRERHIVDSAQIIEFIDLNSNIITDIGIWWWYARNNRINYDQKYEKFDQ